MQNSLKHIPWMNDIIDCSYFFILSIYCCTFIMTGQKWPNSYMQLVFGCYQNLFASSADQQLFVWQHFLGQPASAKKTSTW